MKNILTLILLLLLILPFEVSSQVQGNEFKKKVSGSFNAKIYKSLTLDQYCNNIELGTFEPRQVRNYDYDEAYCICDISGAPNQEISIEVRLRCLSGGLKISDAECETLEDGTWTELDDKEKAAGENYFFWDATGTLDDDGEMKLKVYVIKVTANNGIENPNEYHYVLVDLSCAYLNI